MHATHTSATTGFQAGGLVGADNVLCLIMCHRVCQRRSTSIAVVVLFMLEIVCSHALCMCTPWHLGTLACRAVTSHCIHVLWTGYKTITIQRRVIDLSGKFQNPQRQTMFNCAQHTHTWSVTIQTVQLCKKTDGGRARCSTRHLLCYTACWALQT